MRTKACNDGLADQVRGFAGDEGVSRASLLEPCLRIHAGKSFRGSQAARPRSARDSTADQSLNNQFARHRSNQQSVAARLRSLLTKNLSMSGSITSQTRVTQNLPTDCRLMSTKYLGNRLEVLSCFHKCINLITFSLAEMFIAHKITLTWRSGSLRCQNTLSQPA